MLKAYQTGISTIQRLNQVIIILMELFWEDAFAFSMCPPADSVLLSPQEIDGKALMLLRSDVIMKYMGLKLGPALKLCHHIEKLKQTKQ